MSADDVARAAYFGHWNEVFASLRDAPGLVHATRDHASACATPLHHAAHRCHAPTAARLVAMGADKGMRVADGRTPYDVARSKQGTDADVDAVLDVLRPDAFTLSHLMRREAGPAGYGFLAVPPESPNGVVFGKMLTALTLVPCPAKPVEVAQTLCAAFHDASGLSIAGEIGTALDTTATTGIGGVALLPWRRFLFGLRHASSRSFSARLPPAARVVADAFVGAALSLTHTTTATPLALRYVCHALATTPFSDVAAAKRALDAALQALPTSTDEGAPLIGDDDAVTLHGLLDAFAANVAAHPPATPMLPPCYGWHPGIRSALAAPSPRGVSWVAFGDWGEQFCTAALATGVASFLKASSAAPLDFMLLLGDNFYPDGVRSVEDKRFDTQWADAFLAHPELRVPYKMVVGNHDMNNGTARHQIEYSDDVRNHDGLWQYRGEADPAAPSTGQYTFRAVAAPSPAASAAANGIVATFHVIDTCAAQWNCRRVDPGLVAAFHDQKRRLGDRLREDAQVLPAHRWTFVCGHHGMYTNGMGHHSEGLCLRTDTYDVHGRAMEGLGLEPVLAEHGVDAYYCGHDHVMQTVRINSVDHYGVGAAIECGYYQGWHTAPSVRVPTVFDQDIGFSYNRVVAHDDGSSTHTVQFIRASDGRVLHTVTRHKLPDGTTVEA